MFELFIMALHSSFTAALSDDPKDRLEIGSAILGTRIGSAKANLICMAGLWIFLGAVLGWVLTWAMDTDEKTGTGLQGKGVSGQGAVLGLVMGVVGAPVVVLFYVVCARMLAEIRLMFFYHERWTDDVKGLYDQIPSAIFTWPLKGVIWLSWKVASWFDSAIGPVLAAAVLISVTASLFGAVKKEDRNWIFWSAAMAPVAVLGAPLIGAHVMDNLWNLGKLLLLVAVVWGVPGLLLGILVPYLRKPSENPKVWALAAWIAALLLVLFLRAVQLKWVLLFGTLLALIGLAFWRGIPMEEYWPLIALCVATPVLGGTKLTQGATFLHVQDLSNVLVSEPPLEFSPNKRESTFPLDVPKPSRVGGLRLPTTGLVLPNWKDNPLLLPDKPKKPMAEWLADFKSQEKAVKTLLEKTALTRGEIEARKTEVKAIRTKAGQSNAKAIGELRDADKTNQDLLKTCDREIGEISLTQSSLRTLREQESSIVESMLSPSAGKYIRKLEGDLDQRVKELKESLASLQIEDKELRNIMETLNRQLAEQFELCMNGSIGFWIPLGLLAAWSRHRRIRQDVHD